MGWAGGVRGWGWWWQKLNQRRKKTQMVEFRVATYDMYMHPQRTNIPLQGLDRRALTVGAISGPYSQLAQEKRHVNTDQFLHCIYTV